MESFKTFIVMALGLLIFYFAYSIFQKVSYMEESQKTYSSPLPSQRPELSTFFHALDVAGIRNIFQGTGTYTAFAPTNDAFEKLPNWGKLLKEENKDQLTDLLTYHIVPGKYLTDALITPSLKTINGKTITITYDKNDTIKVNNAKITLPNLEGPNFVIHEIDQVLIP